MNMAIHKTTYKGTYIDNHQEFVCDTRSDIASLPTLEGESDRCPFGSTAFVIEDSSVWMLNSSGQWTEI